MAAIGIFGGSFDPLHNGHLILVQEALEEAGWERLLVVPAWRSPTKEALPSMPGELRLELLQQVFASLPSVRVLDLELMREGPSYTLETIRELEACFPSAPLELLIGSDSLHALHTWKGAQELCSRVIFRVAPRPGFPPNKLPPPVKALPDLNFSILHSSNLELSSHQIRARAARGRSLLGFVPECVARAIQKSRCYSPGPASDAAPGAC